MPTIEKSVRQVHGVRQDRIPVEIATSKEPLLLKGLVADWPVVKAASQSPIAASSYIHQFYENATVGAVVGPPEIEGRIFYNEDLTGFNFKSVRVKLDTVLDQLRRHQEDEHPPVFYVGSTTVDTCLPGFRSENDLDLGEFDPLVSIWLGNRTRVAAHHDVPDNIACCVAGRRRFVLFPPDQITNLYIGPLDFTPAGQAISLVDLHQTDFEKFPRFREALRNAQLAELEPGDALYIPSMWWHHVEGLDAFNVLINYWWRQSPAWMGQPANALEHALLSIRELPEEQRRAWMEVFRYYIFEFGDEQVEHIPEHSRGVLKPIDETMARQLRAKLLNKLNR